MSTLPAIDEKSKDSASVGLACLLASRRARAHEAAAPADDGPQSRQTGVAVALAAAAVKRSRPAKPNREATSPVPSNAPVPVAAKNMLNERRSVGEGSAMVPMTTTRERSPLSPDDARVSPPLRWRCQHFLLANLQRVALTAEAIDPRADPRACRARPMGCTDVDVVYCRAAEEAAYAESDGRPGLYEASVRRIAYALRSGGRALVTTHPADHLAALDDDALSASTSPGRRRLRERARLDECRVLMADTGVFDDAAAAVVRCRRCGGSDITTSLLQTRGADEPMTVFSQCANPKCGARWRQ